jgi:VWFA-related protein
MRRAFFSLIFVILIFRWAGLGAEPAGRLVRLNVSATTSKGEPITDLAASDIEVREDGQVRPVIFFRFAGAKRTTLGTRAGEIANHPGPEPTVILLDRWNETAVTAASAWIDIGAALQHVETVENIFIYFLTNHGELIPVNVLPPADADLNGPPALTPEELRSKLDQAVRNMSGLRSVDAIDPIKRANATFKALETLAGEMAAINGRKSLIWVTHGIPLSIRLPGREWLDMTPQVRAVSTSFSLAQIAIYPVDQSSQGAGAEVGTLSEQTLAMFASLTGGRWYPSNRASEALEAVTHDGRGAYRVAYYAPVRENDKKEHKIRLESSRKGVRLLTREGYFGDAGGPDTDSYERAVFTSECHSPNDGTEIGLEAAATPAADKTHYSVRIDPADVLIEKHGDKYEGDIAVLFAFYSQGVLKSAAGPVRSNFSLSEAQFAQAQKSGLDFAQDIGVPSGVDRVRVLVFDRKLYGIGSVTLPVPK